MLSWSCILNFVSDLKNQQSFNEPGKELGQTNKSNMVCITAMVHHDVSESKKTPKFTPTMSNIESEESKSNEETTLQFSQNYVEEPLTSPNMPAAKIKHMSKSKVGFVRINGTQSCEVPEKELGKHLESKQVNISNHVAFY